MPWQRRSWSCKRKTLSAATLAAQHPARAYVLAAVILPVPDAPALAQEPARVGVWEPAQAPAKAPARDARVLALAPVRAVQEPAKAPVRAAPALARVVVKAARELARAAVRVARAVPTHAITPVRDAQEPAKALVKDPATILVRAAHPAQIHVRAAHPVLVIAMAAPVHAPVRVKAAVVAAKAAAKAAAPAALAAPAVEIPAIRDVVLPVSWSTARPPAQAPAPSGRKEVKHGQKSFTGHRHAGNQRRPAYPAQDLY